MNAILRILILSVLTVAVIAGASVPAWATVNPTTGATTTTVQAKVEWHRSATVGVSGYRVTVHLANGTSSVVAQTGPSGDEIYPDVTPAYLSQQPRYSITTLTSYGWTAVSAKTGVLSC